MNITSRSRDPEDTILCVFPTTMTVRDLKGLLSSSAEEDKTEIVHFVRHRLYTRYFTPLSRIDPEFQSGFLMMSVACLLIETLEAFYNGHKKTPNGRGAFEKFFGHHKHLFANFNDSRVQFYKNIRCGLLHQAQTQGGFRILRGCGANLLDIEARTINADCFLEGLKQAVEEYLAKLKLSSRSDPIWKMAEKKLRHLCDACGT